MKAWPVGEEVLGRALENPAIREVRDDTIALAHAAPSAQAIP
jgi:hypothetical protein